MPSDWSSDVCSRSEEHTSELQSHDNLVCRLLLEKKNHEAHTPPLHRAPPLQRRHRAAAGPAPPWARDRGGSGVSRSSAACTFFFFNYPPPPEISPLSPPGALPV